MNQFRARRAAGVVALPALVATLALAATSGATTVNEPPPPPEVAKDLPPAVGAAPVKADRDGDKLFDDLEARIAAMGPHDRLSVIVSLTAPATAARAAELERRVAGVQTGRRFSIVDGLVATVNKGQAQALTRVPWVAHVEENSRVVAANDGAQSSFGVAKARADMPSLDGDGDGNPSAYSKDDLVAAVIDTGIDAAHADLDGGKVLAFKDFVNGRPEPYDDEGHGTHVAATIAGDGSARADRLYAGVAPAAGLVGVKVLAADGGGTMENVAAGIDWVVQNKDVYGIEAINLSLGASGCADGTDITSVAVNNAVDAGLVVVVAAGNEGPGTCTIGSPGAAAKAITVGAMADTAAGGFSQADFSSRGPTVDGRVKPDVSGPGVGITSALANTAGDYAAYSGTSMATPFAAGVALLARDANATVTPQQVKDAFMSTAVDFGRGGNNRTAATSGVDIDYGAGRLDGHAALKALGAPLASGPVVPTRAFREGTLSSSGAYVDYRFEVADTRFPVAATLILPSIAGPYAYSPDFDLYLYNPSGTLVARAETVYRQETVTFKPTVAGEYRLRVRSYSGSGGFFVDVSAGIGIDTIAPTVTSVSPADGATGLAASTNVTATFSEAMNQAATSGAFSLVSSASGTAVAGAFSWSGNTVTFDPTADLAPGASYTATITTAAKDTAGNALAAAKTWRFAVAPASTSSTVFPSSATLYYGSVRSGDASRLAADDNVYFEVNSTTSGTRITDWYGIASGVPNTATKLSVTYSGKNSRSCSQTIYVYNWTNGSWVKVDGRSVSTTEVRIAVQLSGTLANYVSGSSGDGDVAVRVRCTRSDNFYAGADLLKVDFTR